MTVEMLNERDPDGMVRGWLEAIAEKVGGLTSGCPDDLG